jgi:chitodextrinase
MTHALRTRWVVALAAAFTAAACTMKEQEPPAVTGPSEFAQSISITVTPDVIQQDGASQSVVTVIARGPDGAPLANVPLRADIRVNGVATDFGTISARNLVTDSQGRASLVYTAPPAAPGIAVDEFTVVDIGITPLGSNFGNSVTRVASLRLIPTGTVAPPDGLRPAFTFTPSQPTDNQPVLFDGTTSQSPANNPIARYEWDFGDGQRGSGATTTHAFRAAGTYTVTLTIVDGLGRSRSTSQSVTVGAGENPVARFTSSPTAPVVGQAVNFNAISSTPSPGRRIVSYAWDFGDGTGGSGQQVSHAYGRVGGYVVTLTVTDDVGRTSSVTGPVTILP